MTACVKNHSKRVALAISASLVGALTLGAAAPAVAEAAGIETLALDENAIAGGTVTYRNGESGATFTYNGKKQGLVPTTLTPKGGSSPKRLQLLPSSGTIEAGYYYFYVDMSGTDAIQKDPNGLKGTTYKNADGISTPLTGSIEREQPAETGNYAVVAGYWDGTSNWDVVSIADTFKIAPLSLEGATIFEGNDMSDTTFAFTGKAYSNEDTELEKTIGVAVDGVRLEVGVDVTVEILDATTGLTPKGGIVYPGQKYVAHIEGKNDAYKGETVDVPFDYGKLDLSAATIDGVIQNGAPTGPEGHAYTAEELIETINGYDAADLYDTPGEFTIEYVSSPSGVKWSTNQGTYTFKIKSTAAAKYCFGEKTFTVINAIHPLKVDLSACGGVWSDTTNSYNVDLSADKPSYFDPSKVAFTTASGNFAAEKHSVTITKADGTSATADDLKTPGTYYVNFSVYYTESDTELVAANKTVKVSVYYSVSEDADVFFTFDGENVDGNNAAAPEEVTYSGEDFAPKLSVKVYGGDTELVEGTDYTVSWQRQQVNGAWVDVDSVVDAGDYRYVVTPVGNAINLTKGDGVCYLTVKQMELTPVVNGTVQDYRVNRSGSYVAVDDPFLPYTGSEQAVTFSFVNADGDAVELPAAAYEVLFTYRNKTKEVAVKDVNNYDAHFTDTAEAGNYTVEGDTVYFSVKVADSFADVLPSDWFVGSVYQAKENGYVKGVSGTESYQPNAKILRRDVVVILARMAGMDNVLNDMDEDEFSSEYGTYAEAYSDVQGDAYYAKALAWATKAGVVHGDSGADTFRPDDTITRQEFAAMLSNYAEQVRREDISVDADAILAGANGADTVSGWARDAVAWAYENGIMGNNGASLNGSGDITRAETASMAVNYQAAPLK